MKKLYNLFVFIFCIAIYGQNGNFVSSRIFLDSTKTLNSTTKQIYNIQYFDGLGRLKQSIGVKSSPNSKDIVAQVEYDPFSRISKEFLPLPQNSTQSGMMYSNVDESIGSVLYDDTLLYSENEIENSPIAKILHYGNPGHSWSLNSGHSISYNYKANETIDDVKKYNGNSTWTVANTDIYTTNNGVPPVEKFAVNTLYKTVIADEDGNESINFKNKLGKTVLIRKILNAEETADTYYIYNQYNQLVFVIPPLASAKSELSQTDLDQLCYQYRYDNQNRLVEKKLPGKGWEYMVYDQQDRLVLTQDAMLKTTTNNFAKRGWLFTKYDQFGREVYTGFFANTATRETMQKSLNSMSSNAANNETRDNTGFAQNGLTVYYTKTAFPTGSMTILSVNYYDQYPSDLTTVPTDIQGETTLTTSSQSTEQHITKSLPLASFVKNIETDSWTKSYTFYDLKARAIGTHSYNYLGGYTKAESKLDFSGVPTETYTYHKRLSTDTEIVIKERFEYDGQNRLAKHFHQVNTNPEELLTHNEYNELGQLKNKKVGGNAGSPLQTVDYRYNVRGWMTQINDPSNLGTDLFGYNIKYNDPANVTVAPAKYNGNISEIDWITNTDNTLRRYGYIYDKLNRLNVATYQKPDASVPETHAYDESIYYDLNGNIVTLQRNGTTDGVGGTQIDDLEYYYNGNQLSQVIDESSNYDGYPDTSGNTITYDVNGNMTSLLDKEIKSISYNFLNLPNKITFTGIIGRTSTNINTVNSYRADGVKIKKVHQSPNLTDGIKTKTIDYLDGFQYEDLVLQFIPTAEGYYDFTKNTYIYNYLDHLGNVRLSYYKNPTTGSAEVLEENNYYPFGLKHEGYNDGLAGNPKYQYNYNGKELQETGMYDYGARFYMPEIARWTTLDPLAEFQRKINPYSYCYNNPINFYDPSGMIGEDPKKPDPNKVYSGPTIQEVVLTGKTKSNSGWNTVLDIAEWVPVAGNFVTIGRGIYDGDYTQVALGVVFLAVDVATLGEGSTLIKLGEKAAQEAVEMSAKDALKIAAQDEVKDIAEEVLEQAVVHGNSKLSTKAQHVYEIFEKETGEVVKTGISGGKISKNGEKSYRAMKQVKQLEKKYGKEYAQRIVEKIPAGNGARVKALESEAKNAKRLIGEGQLKNINIHVKPR